jgi:type IV secretory pathway VirJ component
MRITAWLASGVCLFWLQACSHEPRRETLAHGRFEELKLSVPKAAENTVLLLSGAAEQALADELAAQATQAGALITRVDAAAFQRVLDATPDGCVFPSGDLENLARFVQAYAKLPGYRPAILVGLGVGASLAAGALRQAPPDTFAGAIAFDYCGGSALKLPLCPRAARSEAATQAPLVLLKTGGAPCPAGDAEPATAATGFRDALGRLMDRAKARAARPPTSMGDLPVVEIDAGSREIPDTFAVFLSGDGGWAGFDEELSALLAQRGLPIVGFDSLRYFWTARTPESTAADLDHLIQHYQTVWKRKRVVLIGFSQGADVLPFIVNRLPAATRASVASVVAMSISRKASFEFHLSNWLGSSGDLPTLPEMQRLGQRPVYVCGKADADAICPELDPTTFHVITLPGSHHFDDAYETLTNIILESLTKT